MRICIAIAAALIAIGCGSKKEVSTNGGSAVVATTRDAASAAPTKWVIKSSGGGTVSRLAIASDGDVIAAGELSKELVLGDKSLKTRGHGVWVARVSPAGTVRWIREVTGVGDRRYVVDLALAEEGSIVVDVISDKSPGVHRTTVAGDGSKDARTTIPPDSSIATSVARADGVVVHGSLGPKDTCSGAIFSLHAIAADGTVLWSTCNDKNPKAETNGQSRLAASAAGVVFCAPYSGDAPTWGGAKAPESRTGTQSFVASFGPDGKHRWTQYVSGAKNGLCQGLAMPSDKVAAIVYADTPRHGIVAWSSDGTTSWTKPCEELLAGDWECSITAVTAHNDDLIVAVQNGSRTAVSRLDGKTGTTKGSRVFESGAKVFTLAATATAIVFGTALFREADFGTGVLAPSDDESGDVVIGTL